MNDPEHTNEAVINSYLRYNRDAWRPGTVRLRRIQLDLLARALAPTTLVDATEDDLLTWRDNLTGAAETVSSYVSAARGVYRWMSTRARPRIRVDDPAAILDRPKKPVRAPRPMLDRNLDLALSCAVTRPTMYMWIALGSCCGLRCCEIAWMRGNDAEVLPDGCGLLHVTGKGGKRRTVAAGEALMTTLRPWLVACRGPVFPRPSDGNHHTPDRVSQLINDYLRSLGIHETAHSLRHRYGTDFHQLDHDLLRLATQMGHTSTDTTQGYVQVSASDALPTARQMADRRLGARGSGRVA